jgi:hypothetical protein
MPSLDDLKKRIKSVNLRKKLLSNEDGCCSKTKESTRRGREEADLTVKKCKT